MYNLLFAQTLVGVALSASLGLACQRPSDTQLHSQWLEHMKEESLTGPDQSLYDTMLR